MFSRLQIYWCFAKVTVSQHLRYWAFPLKCSFQLILRWWTPNQNVLKLMTQHAQMGISWSPDCYQRKLLNVVSLTNLFEMLYPRLFKNAFLRHSGKVSSIPLKILSIFKNLSINFYIQLFQGSMHLLNLILNLRLKINIFF